jgi:glycosyltransferase involved in cell wall biosynthesis
VASAVGRRLHIGVDARELSGKPTGVGRVLSELLKAWARREDLPHHFTLFSNGVLPAWAETLGSQFSSLTDGGRAGTLWEQFTLPRLASQSAIHVLFAPGYTAPLRLRCPSVLIVFDVSFFAHPEWFRWREGLRRRWLTRASARRAARVVTGSEFSASEIARWLGLPRSRIVVVPPGASSARDAASKMRQPIVLFVGSLFNRRRLPELIDGFARAHARLPAARLILVGDNRTSPHLDPRALAGDAGITGAVEWREYVSDDELAGLYDSARVFAFLSDYEGFALTPMEALAHGGALVLLDTPVGREIYDSAARFVPPRAEAIGDALTALLTDETAHADLVAAGQRLLGRYSWDRAAARILDVLEQSAI